MARRVTGASGCFRLLTELAVTAGMIAPGPSDALEAALDVALIDYTGGIAKGRLVRGDNPVLMTMEIVLEVLD